MARRGVASRTVELPADGRDRIELVAQQRVTERGLVDHVDVVRRGLVVHAPPTVDEGQPLLAHELSRQRLGLVRLRTPPPLEEGDLGVDKRALWILGERLDDRRNETADVGVLDRVVGTAVVLIDRLEPAGVVVRVCEERGV